MNEVLNLLKEKNSCLQKFRELNEKEIEFISSGNFDNLENFYIAREGILGIIQRVDEMIEIASLSFEEAAATAELKSEIQMTLQKRNTLVNSILEQDLEILSNIDKAKSEIIKELAQVRATRKAVGSYKSGQKTQRLDEEA